jgi:hypothetical protein
VLALNANLTHGKIERSMKKTNRMNLKINFNTKRVDYLYFPSKKIYIVPIAYYIYLTIYYEVRKNEYK